MKTPATTPSLGILQSNVARLVAAHHTDKRDELTKARAHKAAIEKSIASRTARDNAVSELDEAASSLSRSARS